MHAAHHLPTPPSTRPPAPSHRHFAAPGNRACGSAVSRNHLASGRRAKALRRGLSFFAFARLVVFTAFPAVAAIAACGDGLIDRMWDAPETADPSEIDWDALPLVESARAIVFQARPGEAGYNMHGYITHHDGRYWAMWSSGIKFEDMAGQQVRYATSHDGMHWSDAGIIAPATPDSEWRYIARGFWLRDGELLALASRDEAWSVVDGKRKKGDYFGPGLEMHWFRYDPTGRTWRFGGVLLKDTITNYPPHRLSSGPWMMSRRDHLKVPSMLRGGESAIDAWEIVSLPAPSDGHALSEPHWWELPDGRLALMFRDDSHSYRLYRALSNDQGKTWSQPRRTNFPDGRAKSHLIRLRDGRYVLVNNPQPGDARIPLALSISTDGLVFSNIRALCAEPTSARHPNPSKRSGYQYPHLMEHGDFLWVAYSRNQEDIEILRIPLRAL